VWDWLYFHAPKLTGLPTDIVAEVYGAGSGDLAEVVEKNLRTGCVGCAVASHDYVLEGIVAQEKWKQFSPLLELRPLYEELRKPDYRIRKDGTETSVSGALVRNPCRMGPLTMEARRWALGKVKDIQRRAGVDLINAEEEQRILEMIDANTWPDKWTGNEPSAALPYEKVNPDGSVQPIMEALLR
jgi:DNA sulfur modification protein DndC